MVNTVGTTEPAVRENCNQCIPMHQQGIKIKTVRQEEFSTGGIKGRRSKAVFPVHTFNCGGPPQINYHPPQISFLFLALVRPFSCPYQGMHRTCSSHFPFPCPFPFLTCCNTCLRAGIHAVFVITVTLAAETCARSAALSEL